MASPERICGAYMTPIVECPLIELADEAFRLPIPRAAPRRASHPHVNEPIDQQSLPQAVLARRPSGWRGSARQADIEAGFWERAQPASGMGLEAQAGPSG